MPNIEFKLLKASNKLETEKMSKIATEIVREHFDPIIGKAQNDYMLDKFQTVDAINSQLKSGYNYYFVIAGSRTIGFLAFYPKEKENIVYLSKFYLYKDERGKGYSKDMLNFVIEQAKSLGLSAIELNVNRDNPACLVYEKLNFFIAREEKNDIGAGFYMDDYVYRLEI